jgi:hypothetical protein
MYLPIQRKSHDLTGNQLSVPPWFKVIIVTLTLLFFFVLYGQNHFYRDPGSIFYDARRAYERHYSLHREREALQYIKNAKMTAAATTANGVNLKKSTRISETQQKGSSGITPICVIIMTFGDRRIGKTHPLEV